jgi:hypothetical protein
MAVSAADCAGLQPGGELHGGGDACQNRVAVAQVERRQPAAFSRVEREAGRIVRVAIGLANSDHVGHSRVDMPIIAGHAPLHAAEKAQQLFHEPVSRAAFTLDVATLQA